MLSRELYKERPDVYFLWIELSNIQINMHNIFFFQTGISLLWKKSYLGVICFSPYLLYINWKLKRTTEKNLITPWGSEVLNLQRGLKTYLVTSSSWQSAPWWRSWVRTTDARPAVSLWCSLSPLETRDFQTMLLSIFKQCITGKMSILSNNFSMMF